MSLKLNRETMYFYYKGIQIVPVKQWEVAGDNGTVQFIDAINVRTGREMTGLPAKKIVVSKIHILPNKEELNGKIS
ncbi:hypothetical protein [Limosilactobacillus reuteri]|uniref:hypothetical protein n=1 Tax=Limosilactobacillus reuteri TaxID=1598 RepID=UPI001EE74FE2|nr:hypothetical protein [Limosilactobacillus reuteri]